MEVLKLRPENLLRLQYLILRVWRQGHLRIHLAGSFRGGKTVGALLALTLHAMLRGGGDYILSGVSKEAALRNTYAYLKDIAEFCGFTLSWRDWVLHMGPVRWHFIGVNDERSAKRIQGSTMDGGLLDEVASYPKSYYYMTLTRCSRAGSLVLTTCNSAEPRHWFKLEVLDRAAETGDYVVDEAKAAIYENFHLPEGFVEGLEAALPPHMRNRGLAGEWVPAEGLVYQQFSLWNGPLPKFRGPPTIGVDYAAADGGTTAAIAVNWHLDRRNGLEFGRYIAGPEYHHMGPLDPNEHAERLLRMWPEGLFVVDPSPAQVYNALLARAPRRVVKADKQAGSVLAGVQHVNALFLATRLVIWESCYNTLKQAGEYAWSDIQAPVTGADRPIKKWDDFLDALRYACSHIQQQQEAVLAGAHG